MSSTGYGLTLSSEEHSARHLIDIAVAAEDTGFDFVSISDHYHPWVEAQGHSPFVWSVLGGIARATQQIQVAVGVTCPIIRIHPAILAQAVATTATLLEGRFTWGVGTGELLNEHVTGAGWPTATVRMEMLSEAVGLIRRLWRDESVSHRGRYFTVEDARIFDLPGCLPPVLVSAFGTSAARMAARVGDGLWTTGVQSDVIRAYRDSGGGGEVWSQLSLSWDPDYEKAVERAHRIWPNTCLPGQMSQDLRTVEHFEQATRLVARDDVAAAVPCGPDPEPIVASIKEAVAAGVDHVYLHQIGDPMDGFLDFWRSEIRPRL